MAPVGSTEDAAVRLLYEQHAAPLLSYALRLTGGDRGRSEDIVQETLLRAWRHPQALDPSRGPVRSWLFTVAQRRGGRTPRATCATARGCRRRARVGSRG